MTNACRRWFTLDCRHTIRPKLMSIDSGRSEGIRLKHPDICSLAACVAMLMLTPVMPAQESAKALTVEGIFSHGSVMGSPPSGMAWSPDGEHLTYLDGGELIDLDPGLKKPHVLVSRAKLATLAGGKSS